MRELVEIVATSDEFNGALPRVVVPSRKVTWPVGAGVPEVPVTVADRVTLLPTTLVDGALRTVAVEVGEGAVTFNEAVALVSPGLDAVMEYVPSAVSTVLLRLKLATPETPLAVSV